VSLCFGFAGRTVSPLLGARGLPRRATERSSATAAAEPQSVRLYPSRPAEVLRRTPPAGEPADHWAFTRVREAAVRDQFVLEIDHGLVLGDYAAVITPGGVLDYETSPYFGITGWREHPLYLRGALPRIEKVDGTLAVLATRGGSVNYYHFLFDVLPRWALLQQTCPDLVVDAIYAPDQTAYQRELLDLAGLGEIPLVRTRKHSAVRADRLVVPSLTNVNEYLPPWVTDWLRELLPARQSAGRPRRIFVTRGGGPNTRRLNSEPELWPELERRGFARIDPGRLTVQEQIDHFAAAEVVVGIHGAALSTLAFAQPGVKVLELFAPRYTKPPFWAVVDNIADATYEYLVGEGPTAPVGEIKGIQDDIDLTPAKVLGVVDRMLS